MEAKIDKSLSHSHYSHVVPNSHFWTDLNQLLENLKHEDISMEYLRIGLANTLERGYNLKSTILSFEEKNIKLLEEDGWDITCNSPFEIEKVENGECIASATGFGVELIIEAIRHRKYAY